MATRFNSVY